MNYKYKENGGSRPDQPLLQIAPKTQLIQIASKIKLIQIDPKTAITISSYTPPQPKTQSIIM